MADETKGGGAVDQGRVTDEELAEVERLDREATPGPWEQSYAYNNAGMPTADFKIPGHNGGATVEILSDDAVFIVRARALLPRLAAEVIALRGEVERLTREKLSLKSVLAAFGGDASKLEGLRVRATYSPARDHEYHAHHRPVRAANDGQSGVIVNHHDSHGLCFDVDHGDAFVTWEPDELHVELQIGATS